MNYLLLRSELRRDEGYSLEAYKDSVGLWTIGVGHLLGTEKRMTRITPAEADALLDADIAAAIEIVRKLVPEMLNGPDPRLRVLVNMAFNLGGRLGQFKKFLAAVREERWLDAAAEMMASKWATQVGKRATRLRDALLAG